MNKNNKRNIMMHLLGALQGFVGVTAILGGFMLVWDPSGARSNLPLEWLSGSPFPDYFIPGMILLAVNGIGNVLAAGLTFLRNRYACEIAVVLSTFLIVYMIIEVLIVGLRNFLQPLYVVLGLIALMLGLNLARFSRTSYQMPAQSKMRRLPT